MPDNSGEATYTQRFGVRTWLHDGLAVYEIGVGPPLLLVPNPQGMVLESASRGDLALLLAGMGRRVVTFDPPGAFGSRRPPVLGLDEMVACCAEALAVARADPPVDVVAHSQATVCALALAIRAPDTVHRMVLVGAVDGGWRATRRARGMPWCWSILDRRFWRFAWLALPLALGRSTVDRLKRLQRLYLDSSFVNPRLAPAVVVRPEDHRHRAPRRSGWQASIRSADLRPQLGKIRAPTVVCVGRDDPQTPVGSNIAIAAELPRGRAMVFERSGHYPFIEEPDAFRSVVEEALRPLSNPQPAETDAGTTVVAPQP